jgi:hypothetical protein
MRTISPELIRAYREAHYIVLGKGKEIRLQVASIKRMATKLFAVLSLMTKVNQ